MNHNYELIAASLYRAGWRTVSAVRHLRQAYHLDDKGLGEVVRAIEHDAHSKEEKT